jgi:hypothetical protein
VRSDKEKGIFRRTLQPSYDRRNSRNAEMLVVLLRLYQGSETFRGLVDGARCPAAAKGFVVDFKVRHPTAELAASAISVQYLLAQLPIIFPFESDRRPLPKRVIH